MGIKENIRDAEPNGWLTEGLSQRRLETKKRFAEVAIAIYKARIAKGWTEKDLADRLGVDEDTVFAWEDADINIDAETLEMIADALDLQLAGTESAKTA
jgi:ribosome-binding protein aMBF1 (putative translation factor)